MSWEQGVNTNADNLRSVYVMHKRVQLDASEGGKTRQEFADECDINVLLARYEKHGVLNHFNAGRPEYFDASNVPDLQSALDIVAKAEQAFMTLPAKVRAEFENDPVRFVAYAEDPANLERMREWNLAPPAPVEAPPVKVEWVNAPKPGDAPASS